MRAPVTAEEATAIMRAAGATPVEDYPGSIKKPWRVRCDTCETVLPRITQHVRSGRGCRACRNVLAVKNKGLVPKEPYVNGRAWWSCHCTHCDTDVRIQAAEIAQGGACPGCKKVTTPEGALAEMREYGFEPTVPYPGANEPWPSLHGQCGKLVEPALTNLRFRRGRGTGCRYCSGRALDPADAAAFMQSKGWVPLEPFPGPRSRWSCLHTKCGNPSTPTYKSVRRGHGCRFCNKQGIDYSGPGYVYVMTNDRAGAVKIGIYGKRAQRDRKTILRRYGWETFKLLPCPTGEQARQIEQAVLRHLRHDRGLPPFMSKAEMPQNGASETFGEEHVTALEMWELVWGEAERHGVTVGA